MEEKTELEQYIQVGIGGPLELKREERNLFLGQFRERIIKCLTFKQVAEKGTYTEIEDAIRHPKAKKLIVSQKVRLSDAKEYINLARENNLNFSIVSSPGYKGDIGLVVVSNDPVEEEFIYV